MGYISEDYCSEELSGMLMERGYIGAINTYLGKDDINVKQITIQSAMKWLREKEIFVEVTHTLFSSPHKYQYSIFRTEPEFYTTGDEYKSYEEAAEAAIKYCLENLI